MSNPATLSRCVIRGQLLLGTTAQVHYSQEEPLSRRINAVHKSKLGGEMKSLAYRSLVLLELLSLLLAGFPQSATASEFAASHTRPRTGEDANDDLNEQGDDRQLDRYRVAGTKL